MGQAVDDFVDVVFESAGKVYPFHFERQRSLFEEFLVVREGIVMLVAAFVCDSAWFGFALTFKLHERPDGLTNGNKTAAGFEYAFGLTQDLHHVDRVVENGGADHIIEMIIREIELMKIARRPSDFGAVSLKLCENLGCLVSQ